LEVNTLTLSVDNEDLGIVLALKVDLLEELFVNIGSEHDINGLLLSREESAR
jgi:hypothetical protein